MSSSTVTAAAQANPDLSASLGRSRQAQEDAESSRPAAAGDHGLAANFTSGEHVTPPTVLFPRQVPDESPVDVDCDGVRIVRIVRLGDEDRDLLEPNLLVGSASAQLEQSLLVMRGSDDADKFV